MKKHSSVFMLIARSTLYKLIPIVFGTSIIQAILFFLSLNSSKFISAALEDGSSLYSYWGIEEVISRGFIPVVSGIAFLLLTLSLCLFGMNRGSKESYTLLRLSVSEKRIFVYHTVFSIGAYIIFWAFQLITMFILCNIYCKLLSADTSYISGQTIMLAFYRSNYLHSLMPLTDITRHIRNVFLILSLGFSAAHFSYKQRRGKFSLSIITVSCLTLVFFPRALGSMGNDILLIALLALCLYAIIKEVFGKGDNNEE